MISTQSAVAQMQSRESYTDLTQLQKIKNFSGADNDLALRQLSKQFESLFLHMMLKSMRTANEVFEKDNETNSFELKMHRDMLDHQLALSVSKGSGIGLADTLYKQLIQQFKPEEIDQTENALPRPWETISAADSLDSTKPKMTFGTKQPIADSPQTFIEKIYPHAQIAANQLGVDPKVLLAQAALETGWGEHVIHDREGNNGFNLFNIKADQGWSGESIAVSTVEYHQGLASREKANFRRYDNLSDGFSDYVKFLTSGSRYKPALSVSDDAELFIRELHKAGYATDPKYADKVLAIVESQHLN